MNTTRILITIAFITSLLLFYPSIVYVLNSYLFEASAFFNLIVAIATAIICYLTSISVKAVIKSNSDNREANEKNRILEEKKFTNDIYEKRFSTLLTEHEYYLKQLLGNINDFYKLPEILKLSGYESLSIIRGEIYFNYINEKKYAVVNDEIYLSIDSALSLNNFYSTSPNIINIKQTLTNYKTPDHYICKEGFIYWYNNKGEMKTCSKINKKLGEEGVRVLSYIVSNLLDHTKKGKVSNHISHINEISKNILSPYMRIIYHILKLAYENASKTYENNELCNISHEMKKSTNIIRSMIPNNILALIAINSTYFYKNKLDEIGAFSSSKERNNNKESIENKIFNDYRKYYKLLVISDFFEHLYLEKNETYITKYSNCFVFNFNKFNSSFIIKKNNTTFIGVTKFTEDDIIKFYYRITDLFYSNTTKELLYLFYIKNNQDYNKKILDNIDFNIESFAMDNQLELESNEYKTSHYFKGENKLILGCDFALTYVNGELISGLTD